MKKTDQFIYIWLQAFGCENYCQQCFSLTSNKREFQGMGEEDFFRTIDEIYQAKKDLGMPVSVLLLSEPFAAPYWRKVLTNRKVSSMLDYGGQRIKGKLIIPTNAYTLARDQNAVRELAGLGVGKIALSFYAGDAKLHDAFAGRKGAFNDLMTVMQRLRETQEVNLDIYVYPFAKTFESIPGLLEEYIAGQNKKNYPQEQKDFLVRGLFPTGRLYRKLDLLPTEKQIQWLIKEFARITNLAPEQVIGKYIQGPEYFDSERNAIKSLADYFDSMSFLPDKPWMGMKTNPSIAIENDEVYHSAWCNIPPSIRDKNKELFLIDKLHHGKSLTQILNEYRRNFSKHPVNKLRRQHEKNLPKIAKEMLKTATDKMVNTGFIDHWFDWMLASYIQTGEKKVVRSS